MYIDLLLIHSTCVYIYLSFVSNLFFFFGVKLLPIIIPITIQFIYTNILFIYFSKNNYMLFTNISSVSSNLFYMFIFIYNQKLLIKSKNRVRDTLSNKLTLSSPRSHPFISPKSSIRILPAMESLLPNQDLV